MATLLSDADVGFASGAKLLSDSDVGFAAPKQSGMSSYKEAGTEPPIEAPAKTPLSDYKEAGTEPYDEAPVAGSRISRVVDAAAQGWKDTPSVGVPAFDQSPLGQQIVNPAMKIAAGVVPGPWNPNMNAGMAALSQAAMEVFGEKGGRDALAMLASLPMVHPEMQAALLRGRPTDAALSSAETAAARPQFVSERTAPDVSELDPRNAISQLIQHDIAENPPATPGRGVANQILEPRATVGDVMGAPDIDSAIAAASSASKAPLTPEQVRMRTPMRDRGRLDSMYGVDQSTPEATVVQSVRAAATPQSAGAASREITPQNAFGRSAREIKGAQADMELADLMRTPEPGYADDIIPGATQTRAEIELSPSVSREAKGLRQEFREGFNEHEKVNNELYHNWVDDVVPPREQIGSMKDLREDRWTAGENTVFGPNRSGELVSTAPVVQHLLDLFDDPIEKHNSYAERQLRPFLDKLTDDSGNPIEIGAKELYGIRREMGRKVKDMATDTDLAHLRDQFGDLMKVTDDAITGGAPDYRTMMDNYREDSIPINAAERLQDIKTKITNGSDRVITFGQFDRYMKSLWMERNGPNPYAPAKDIPQSTWDHLMTLHQRLARSASADELARTKGSDTTQLMGEMIRKGMIGVGHAAAAHFTGGLGNIAIPYITKQIDTSRALKRVDQHLNPDLSKYPPVGP